MRTLHKLFVLQGVIRNLGQLQKLVVQEEEVIGIYIYKNYQQYCNTPVLYILSSATTNLLM